MRTDDDMDRLLRAAMYARAPQLSSDFDARVLQRVRPRRLTTIGRAVLLGYAVMATTVTAWLLRDVPGSLIVVSGVGCATVAVVAGAYARRLAAAAQMGR